MIRTAKQFLGLAVLALMITSCSESLQSPANSTGIQTPASAPSGTVLPKGDRILELDANPAETEDYDQTMELARQLGAESIRLSVYWDEIETSPGVFSPDPNWLAIANQYYSAQNMSISLVISVLDTTEVRLPADLQRKSFDDPVISARFAALLDFIHSQLPDVELTSLAIGNEIDGVLGGDPAAWQQYQSFYDPAAAYARELWPDLPVSTKVTYDGLIGAEGGIARGIYTSSPVVMITYYPLQADFTVKDPDLVRDDFQKMVGLFPNKEIYIMEIGYPTSESNNSSPEKQAQFIQAMFQAWDDQADQITFLSYSWLTDLPEAAVSELESYYGVSSKNFGEFLGTLGLRTHPGDGENKPGFETFLVHARARGW